MSVKDRGFASASKERRKELAGKGGKRAHEMGKAHIFTPDEARAASKIGSDRKKVRQAQAAAMHLMFKYDFTAEQLHGLSLDEFIYFGGAKSTNERIRELKARLKL